MSDDTTNDENGYRQGSEERKGALKVFLRALGDLRGGYFHISSHERSTAIKMKTETLSVSVRTARAHAWASVMRLGATAVKLLKRPLR